MDPMLTQQLRDIRGLDAISWWWPPANGWWLLLIAMLLLTALGWELYRRRYSWRIEARRTLKALRRRLPDEQSKRLVADFSELLRRIAMARYSRQACAGLVGEEWLIWLQEHDPKNFRWREEGRILLLSPYAPPGASIDIGRLPLLFNATLAWIETELPQAQAGHTLIRRSIAGIIAALRSFFNWLIRPDV